MDTDPTKLAPPAVTSLRAQTAGALERSHSQNQREKEREDLREAAEQTLNVIVDLNLDASIRWVSPSWVDVIGTKPAAVEGTSIADVVVSEPTTIFTDVVEFMKEDDSGSKFIRFSVKVGPESKLLPPASRAHAQEAGQQNEDEQDEDLDVVDLEAQGIMVHDTDGESHVMWMIRPWVAPREIKIDLDSELVDSLGSGAEVLAGYLTRLAEAGLDDPTAQTPPPPVLCRICERQIPPWWFEKHTDLCLQEHQAEMEVQMAQESLTEHRHAIVKVLDTLEARKSRPHTGEQITLPIADYKGMPIGPPQSNSSSPGTASPSTSGARSRERSSGFCHTRAKSFAVRRPQARIVELLLDLCDTAIEISTPAIKDSSTQNPGEFRTQSPQSESRIAQVMQWHSPSTNTLEQEHGLALLCADTERIAKAKIDAVFRHRKIIEYAERIRIEFAIKVQDCIDGAMRRAVRIATGQTSDSAESESEIEEDSTPAQEEGIFSGSFDAGNTLAMALEKADLSGDLEKHRFTGPIDSTRSSSPKECPTPRSHHGMLSALGRESRRESLLPESDTGDTGESEGSVRSSSVASRPPPRTESPISEFGDLRRQASSRSHNRRSWILPGAISPRRQESPSRGAHQPSSPLRISKPRNLGFPQEGIASPEPSPKLLSSEFGSPVAVSHHHHHHHHRRQSSAAISTSTGDNIRLPPSPRLNGVAAPPMARAVPPSIKDFEVIKPISKGAFGSVYLSKKKSTGEYFAIKVLKKADMVAKNQVTNVKAERAIMMWQGESDFVAKLYWTFSSKDYLYLVMEYLNGGDCASLIKVLGGLPEDWVKKYLGEVVLGVEHLHSRGIVHRDLKPDNLLIDQKGHLKLTDFGLSRMGLVGRQKRALHGGSTEPAPDLLKTGPFARSTSVGSSASRSTSLDVAPQHPSPGSTPQMTPSDFGISLGQPSYFNLGPAQQEPRRISSSHRSDSGGSETLTHMFGNFSLNDSHQPSFSQAIASPHDGSEGGSPSLDVGALRHTSTTSTQGSMDQGRGTPPQTSMPPPNWALFDPEDTSRRFVGTPDYLAPETIRGEPQDETSDWWSVGCILYEFLYGVPPFHAGEPEQVFENILARRIHWPDESEVEVSPEAKDLINKLLCIDPQERLGCNKDEKFASGGEEIRNHPWFQGLSWESLLQDEAQFVPQPENPEDTEYFDARGATLQAFAEEMEDQMSPQPGGPATDYPERPHDALSRVRSQVNSIKRGLMPLHIPPHVRDLKSRRLSEPMANDDFGNFAYKNLPVLDKANKDVIQKLRADALAAQSKASAAISPGGINQATSPGAVGLEGSPVLSNPVHRSLSNAKASQRPQSPSGLSNAHSSPSRVSQPSSPLLVSFVAGQEGRRKASSNASNLSQQSSSNSSLQPGNFFDVPRVPPSLQKAATTVAVSPGKGRGSAPPLSSSPHKTAATTRPGSGSGPSSARSRSRTVGSQEGSPVAADLVAHHRNRRSQVFDMSPSSSDNEGDKANAALLRVQRRRQSSRRMSQIAYDCPSFRPLDVLICEDHPVSRMVMEKLLEKLRCRTISASTGPEAVRYAMSDIKFDVIFMEFKLPQISGADVAKMIRETKNANSHTPLVAITAYLKELQAPHYFDSLIEKPISSSKLTEVLTHFCQWKTASPSQSSTTSLALAHPIPSSLRQESLRLEDSPTSGTSSSFANQPGSSFRGSSREDSVSSSLFGDSESISADEIPVVISRKATGDWSEHGLGIEIPSEELLMNSSDTVKPMPTLTVQNSAPGQVEHDLATLPLPAPQPRHSFEKLRAKRETMEKRRLEGNTGIDSADDEDEELGLSISGKGTSSGPSSAPALFQTSKQHFRSKSVLPSSKLGVEMMRANSHDSVNVPAPEGMGATDPGTKVLTTPKNEAKVPSQLSGPTLAPSDLHAGGMSSSPTPIANDEEKTTIVCPLPSVEGIAAEPASGEKGADINETPKRPSTAERETTPTEVEDAEEAPTPRPRERTVDVTSEQTPEEKAKTAEDS
ncbi:Serine/threonine-protein kinase cek1 [Cytospora mali]|uniref:non-specific serine/threonine protein kinase n=1 Tax=Cytospora mali TaxID=578113 RepID=A0A194VAG6_CYTMA|nr:Serine/threonine-protein kinase cek1 [Valsa mali var. pyri (nom. inval.)]